MRLLLVEDTPDVAEAIVIGFTRKGEVVDHATTLERARLSLAAQHYDAVILDIALPDGEGTDLLRDMRKAGMTTPVMMLTARFSVEDRVSSLDEGADDYLVKPFDSRELEARVRALVRRAPPPRELVIEYGDLTVYPAEKTALVRGEHLSLSRREFSLLETLLSHRGRVASKEGIFNRMFSFDEEDVGINAIELYVSRLRRKLAGSRVTIHTLRGLGYQLTVDD